MSHGLEAVGRGFGGDGGDIDVCNCSPADEVMWLCWEVAKWMGQEAQLNKPRKTTATLPCMLPFKARTN